MSLLHGGSAPDPAIAAAEDDRRSGRGRVAPPWVYFAAALPLSSAAYLVVQFVYAWEQGRAGLLTAPLTPAQIVAETVSVHAASFGAWLLLAAGASLAVRGIALTLYRSQQRLIEASEAQALRDPLTGLHNRRAMNDHLELLHALAERSGRPYSVISLDADGLKSLNDTAGHAAGDDAIRDIADTLRATSRAIDVCIRLGGDEFVVLLPDASLAASAAAAERLLEALRERRAGDPARRLAVSMGVAGWRKGLAPRDVLRRADALLYEAKRAGKGRVVADQEGTAPAPAG